MSWARVPDPERVLEEYPDLALLVERVRVRVRDGCYPDAPTVRTPPMHDPKE